MTADTARVVDLIEKHRGSRGSIIAILEDIQATYNYLPEDALRLVAERTGHSLVDLYAVATFYTSFSLVPRGEHLVSVCMGTACHVRGSPGILEEFQNSLEIAPGETTSDRAFSLTTVNCLGACALGPVAVIDGDYCRNVRKPRVSALVRACRDASDAQPPEDPDEPLFVHALCPHCNRSLLTDDHKLDGHPMIHITVASGRKHGWFRFSSVLGDHRIQSEHELTPNSLLHFFCPRCHAELRSTQLCPKCDAPRFPLLNRGGGILHFCSRRGCKEDMFDLR